MEQFCAVVDTGRRGAAFIAAEIDRVLSDLQCLIAISGQLSVGIWQQQLSFVSVMLDRVTVKTRIRSATDRIR